MTESEQTACRRRSLPCSPPAYAGAPRTAALLVLAGVLLLAGCGKREGMPAGFADMPVKVEVTQVKTGAVEQLLSAVGSLSSPQDTVISPQISGQIVALDIQQGEVVRQGAVLARLDDAIQRAALQSAQAALFNARQIYRRDRQVEAIGAVSAEKVQSDLAALRQAEAALAQARANLQYTFIRSPFSGVLGLRQVSVGAYVSPGNAIVSIRQLDPLYLDFNVPQEDVSYLKTGQAVRFTVAGLSGAYTGQVTTVDQALATGSRSVHVQATIPNAGGGLKPGMFAAVQLVVGSTPDAVLVPMQAVFPEGELQRVWVVGPDDRAVAQTVTVGEYQDNWVQIRSGLKPADRVVTGGLQKVHPNAKLIIEPYAPIHNPRLDLSDPADATAETRS